ncbi:MAG: SpoIIE family protein phosphatase [Acidobacteriota bacterium]
MRKMLLLLLLCVSAAAWAQTRIDQFPAGVVRLTEGWRYQKGDNPAWAAADFNDSGWQKLAPQRNDDCAPACWYRLRVELPPHHGPLAFFLEASQGVSEVYIDGRRAGDLHFLPWWLEREALEHVLPIAGDKGAVVLAIRVHVPRIADDPYEATKLGASIGSPEAAQWESDLNRQERLLDFVLSGAVNLAIVIAGAGVLLLFLTQRGQREYLWLGLYLVLLGSSFLMLSGSNDAIVPGIANDLFGDPAIYLFIVAQVEFTYAFIGRRLNRAWRLYEGLLLLGVVGAVLCATGVVTSDVYFFFESAVTLPAAIALPLVLLYWSRRGNHEARLLIVPSLFPAAGVIITNLPQFAGDLGWDVNWLTRPLYLWGDIPLFGYDLADLIFLLAIGVVMFFRFSRLSEEQARSVAEMSAAREIQRQLVPAALPTVPGCQLEAVYLPAAEVGGDFYQVLPQPDGSWLILVGDVSGKGLKAAMTGALAIGSLRTLAAEMVSPALLLTRLNRQMVAAQQGGFITCLCASIAADGKIALANAGHLLPYRNGEEVQLEGSLPLGVWEGETYEQTTLELYPGDRITLLTDGVVEAQSADELFGFERTRELSQDSAASIAAAAQLFGQQDDITVLTLMFLPVAELKV